MRPELISFGVALSLFGLHAAWTAIPSMLRGRQSLYWPETQGVVVGGYIADAEGRMDVTTYSAGVVYEYEINGTQHRSGIISYRYALPFFRMEAVIRAKAPYSDGRQVPVYYDPRRPSRAVLEPGVGAENWLAVLISCSVGLLGLLFLAVGFSA